MFRNCIAKHNLCDRSYGACCNIHVSNLFIIDDDVDEKLDTSQPLWISSNNRVGLQYFSGSFRSLIDQLNSQQSSFVTHIYITRQQRYYIKTIKLNCNFSTFAVAQMDFAQSFSFVVHKQIQSAHWNQKQATFYTVSTLLVMIIEIWQLFHII